MIANFLINLFVTIILYFTIKNHKVLVYFYGCVDVNKSICLDFIF